MPTYEDSQESQEAMERAMVLHEKFEEDRAMLQRQL